LTASEFRVSFGGDRNILKRIVAMAAQFCDYTKTTELYILKTLALGGVNYISIKMLKLLQP
jgi:hypothetical protein